MTTLSLFRGTLLALLFCVAAAVSAQDAPADPPADAPRLNFDLGADILVFTEPVREDGTIDYIAAFNAQYSQGITQENNAFRDLFVLFSHKDEQGEWEPDAQYIEGVMDVLGLAEADLDGGLHLVDWYEYALDQGLTDEQAWDLLDRFAAGPLTDEESALITGWIEQVEPVLLLAGQAVQKPRYYAPMIGGDEGFLTLSMLPNLGQYRRLARAIEAYAWHAVRQGEPEKVVESIRTLRQLALQVSREPSLIGGLVALSIDALTAQFVQDLVVAHALSEQTLAQIDALWRERPPLVPVGEAIGGSEKAMAMDIAMQFAAGRVDFSEIDGFFGFAPDHWSVLGSGGFDMNRSLTQVSAYYDRFMAVYHTQDPETRRELGRALNQEIDAIDPVPMIYLGGAEDQGVPNPLLYVSVQHRTDTLIAMVVHTMCPALGAVMRTELRSSVGQNATLLAIACERFRLEHDRLPETLGALVPTYLAEVPSDPFDGEPLRYRITEAGFLIYSVGENLADDGGVMFDALDERADWVITIEPEGDEG